MRKKTLSGHIAWLFKPWIVKRPNGGCQVLFPLSELDNIVAEIIKLLQQPSVDVKINLDLDALRER